MVTIQWLLVIGMYHPGLVIMHLTMLMTWGRWNFLRSYKALISDYSKAAHHCQSLSFILFHGETLGFVCVGKEIIRCLSVGFCVILV